MEPTGKTSDNCHGGGRLVDSRCGRTQTGTSISTSTNTSTSASASTSASCSISSNSSTEKIGVAANQSPVAHTAGLGTG